MRRHLPAAAGSGYGTNARTENKISPLSPVTPTSPITPSIDLPSIIPSQPAPGAGQTTDASHEWSNNHYDITIYPADYKGSYSGADHDNSGDDE